MDPPCGHQRVWGFKVSQKSRLLSESQNATFEFLRLSNLLFSAGKENTGWGYCLIVNSNILPISSMISAFVK